MAYTPQSLLAQGDGARAHGKELLTNTNIISMTYLHGSGNVNPLDPAYSVLLGVDADFTADVALLGYSRSFSLFDRTAVASIVLPVGEVKADVTALETTTSDSARGFGDPLMQIDVNLIGAPAMKNIPDLMRYDPKFTMDFVASLALPIGEYDGDSLANLGQNRWYGRIGTPIVWQFGAWIPGQRTTLEVFPSVWLFGDNDDFAGENFSSDPTIEIETHLTRDFTSKFWGSVDATYILGGDATIGAAPTASGSDTLTAGFTLGYQLNDNMQLTLGYKSTLNNDAASNDLRISTFSISLVSGWHRLLEGVGRLSGGG
jgi:hypothetical protein